MKSQTNNLRNGFNKFFYYREFQIGLILIIGIIVLGATSPFLSAGNISSIMMGIVNQAIIGIGMTLLLVGGGFDLSVGSVFALGGIVASIFAERGVNIVLSMILGVIAGLIIGIINGIVVVKIGVNPLIATLGMLGIARGIVLVITHGLAPSDLPESFKIIGQNSILNIQIPIYIMLFLIIISAILLSYTKFFRQYYFIGGNEKAALLTGIKTKLLKFIMYVITSGLAAFAGIIFTSRIGASSLQMGEGLELSVISACLIGGCSLEGGKGSIFGTFLGVLLLGIVLNAFSLLGFSIYWQRIVQGIILIGAVSTDSMIMKRGGGSL